ncbi:hypothetical protein [Bacillus norwichensis]|uniref:Uncharacterized protein n=1 Tax=Bacillus norwichensis TaxID=2762217 RepID=A0ABR8VPW1_9BACI|nr:hypothetical protein [Bacillus norwichensis]MBD8006803.1 hypothetical protein [Bacillus norwichensis]
MSLPNIPNITPLISLDRCDTINLLLSSIALEEISLSHLLNAEGEKLQQFLKQKPVCIDDFLNMNHSINKTLQTIVKSQMLLVLKLEEVVSLAEQSVCCDGTCDCNDKHHQHDCNECSDQCDCFNDE